MLKTNKNKIELNSIIRHHSPYWGESAFKIVEWKDNQDYLKLRALGGKNGPGGSILQLQFESVLDFYEICPWYTILWLWVLGQTYGRF